MSGFDERGKGEEQRFKLNEELRFKARNRRNRIFGQWIAITYLGLEDQAAADYAKDVVMSDFEAPGDHDMLEKVKADLAKAGATVSDHTLAKQLGEFEIQARQQVMSE
jgi:hypothetical protein